MEQRGKVTDREGAELGNAADAASLRVLSNGRLLFHSYGRWLYPLFDLEEFLRTSDVRSEACRIEDKIIGKAAAMLIVRMGFGIVHGETMSRLAAEFFEKREIHYTYGILVDRIDCRTESLLEGIEGVDEAYRIVRARARR